MWWCLRVSGWALTPGVKAAGSRGAEVGKAPPGRSLTGIKRCAGWSFKVDQPHNLQKSKPCSLGSINRPQIESDPFIFQAVCEKEKKNLFTKIPGLFLAGLEGTVTFN